MFKTMENSDMSDGTVSLILPWILLAQEFVISTSHEDPDDEDVVVVTGSCVAEVVEGVMVVVVVGEVVGDAVLCCVVDTVV